MNRELLSRIFRKSVPFVIATTFLLFLWLFTWGRVEAGRDDTAWAHWLLVLATLLPAGLLMGRRSASAKENIPERMTPETTFLRGYWLLALAAFVLFVLLEDVAGWFQTMPMKINFGDVIPQIRIMNWRLLEGENPYAAIWDFGYEIRTPYLTMHWLPFLPAEWLDFDLRWIVVGIWGCGTLIFANVIRQLRISPLIAAYLVVLPGLFVGLILRYQPVMLGATVELLICGYYLILGSLLLKNASSGTGGWIAVLLSRYGAVFFFPVWLKGVTLSKGRKVALVRTSILAGAGLFLFVIPFWLPHPEIVGEGLAYHGKVTHRRWVRPQYHGPNDKPAILYEGTGLAREVYESMDRHPRERVVIAKWLHPLCCLALTFLLFWWTDKTKWRRKPYRVGSFLLSLTVFYQLLPLPIDYYFSVLCTVLIVAVAASFVEDVDDVPSD